MYQVEKKTSFYGEYEAVEGQIFQEYDQAVEACGIMFDSGDDAEYVVRNTKTRHGWRIPPHLLRKEECPGCGKMTRIMDMEMTYDCHGIPFRLLCQNCYNSIMESRGYDGEYYDENDENLDYEY